MAGTRTAPALTGAASFREISLRWIDAVGDRRADASIVATAATNAQLETVAADMQAATNASLFAVRLTDVFKGAIAKSNAVAGVRESAQDNIVYHGKDSTQADRRAFVPAPLAANFVTNTETPDETATTMVNVMAAWDTVWAGSFAGVSLRFTERREINEKVNL